MIFGGQKMLVSVVFLFLNNSGQW